MRNNHKKAEQEIILVSGKYLHDFTLALTFTSGKKRISVIVDFLPLFQEYVRGDNLKYYAPVNFKKFIIKDGNIFWGKDEDIIFPSSILLDNDKTTNTAEEILYII